MAAIPCIFVLLGFVMFPLGFAAFDSMTVGFLGFAMFGVCGAVLAFTCIYAAKLRWMHIVKRQVKQDNG